MDFQTHGGEQASRQATAGIPGRVAAPLPARSCDDRTGHDLGKRPAKDPEQRQPESGGNQGARHHIGLLV